MKVTSVILLLCIIGSAFAQICSITKCAKGGELCGYPVSNTTRVDCRGDSYCRYAGSRESSGVCHPTAKLGDSCDVASCESSTTCYDASISGDGSYRICAAKQPNINFKNPGDSCDYELQCSFNSPYSSSSPDNVNLCRSGRCKHIKNGEFCNDDKQCNYNGAYCGNDRLCHKYINDGGACNLNDQTGDGCGKVWKSRCMPNSMNGNAGTCRKYHSVKEGQFCRSTDDCKEGLYCEDRSDSSSNYGTCYKPIKTATLGKPCTASANCTLTNYESCQCVGESQQCIVSGLRPSGFHDANYDAYECGRKNGCGGDFTCLKDKCKSQTCRLYKVNQKLDTATVSCSYEGLCNSAFALVASPILAFLAFVVVFAL